jgi:hypothetical protein
MAVCASCGIDSVGTDHGANALVRGLAAWYICGERIAMAIVCLNF